jgi:alanine racemase
MPFAPQQESCDLLPASNTWLEVDLAALRQNFRNVRERIGKRTRLCAVVKADAYGAGIGVVVPVLVAAGVDTIGIVDTDEAAAVRMAGFEGTLIRLRCAAPDEITAALPFAVEEMVATVEAAQHVAALSVQSGRTIPVHLSLNCGGMGRDGLELGTPEGEATANALVATEGLQIVGIATHFPSAERPDMVCCLDRLLADTRWLFGHTRLRREAVTLHAANSLTTLEYPPAHLDMVRIGAGLYGCVGPKPPFRHVLTLKSRVAAIQSFPAGTTVGYDRTFCLKRPSRLASVPVGYSDGYRRSLSNRAAVVVGGERAPVVGKVSMNTLTVDVTDIAGVAVGSEVVLFGAQGDARVTQDEVETFADVVLADLFSVWGALNPRIISGS